MPIRYYRLSLLVCAAAWLLLGMHLPVLHQITHHGRMPSAMVLVFMAAFALLAVTLLWRLMRVAPAQR
jgi:hypothetical protein